MSFDSVVVVAGHVSFGDGEIKGFIGMTVCVVPGCVHPYGICGVHSESGETNCFGSVRGFVITGVLSVVAGDGVVETVGVVGYGDVPGLCYIGGVGGCDDAVVRWMWVGEYWFGAYVLEYAISHCITYCFPFCAIR